MMPPLSFLDTLKTDADRAAAAEGAFRREQAQRLKALEQERAFAFRRLNLMRSVVQAVAASEEPAHAVAAGVGVLRAKLGWTSDSEPRSAVLSRFALVAESLYTSLAPRAEDAAERRAPEVDVIQSLTEFEQWYASTHATPFWVLFEQYVAETPLVDF